MKVYEIQLQDRIKFRKRAEIESVNAALKKSFQVEHTIHRFLLIYHTNSIHIQTFILNFVEIRNLIYMKALIFAAGFGTRLKPVTDSIPKALVPINGKPLLEYVILKMKDAGINEIIINVHHFPDQIVEFLRRKNNFNLHIEISDERDLLLDTGGGIKKAAHFFNDDKPFLIHNVDILSNVDLNEIYQQHLLDPDRLVSLVVSYRDTFRYLLFDEKNRLKGWVNTKTGKTKPMDKMDFSGYHKYAFAGIQVVSPAIFDLMKDTKNVFPIMDFYLQHCSKAKIVGYIPDKLRILDAGTIGALKKADDFIQVVQINY